MNATVWQRRTRLATRVALSMVAGGALAGTLAAVSAVIAVDQMVGRHADRRLSGAAEILAGEIDEGFEEDGWEPLGEIVMDENGELAASGIRLAVYSDGHRIAGDRWVPRVAPGGCTTRGVLGARVRACARVYRDWVLVAAAHSDEAALRWIYLLAAGGSLALGALLGSIVSLRLTAWALRPLTALSDDIRKLEPDGSRGAELGTRSNCDEVELIRDALSDLLRRSEALLEQAQRFAADAAHELRTPLTAVRAEVELLLEEASSAAEREALQRVSERTKQLADLVARLLVLASPSKGGRQRHEAVALSELIEEVVADLPASRRERVRLHLRAEGLTRGDPSLLRSMLANALDNALKFAPDQVVEVVLDGALVGDDAPASSAGTAPALGGGASIRIDVRDRGPGVAAAQRERVFEPFFRARPDATPGHGLGLSLIAHIVHAHGGSARFVDVDGGACLRLTLPGWQPD